MELAVAIAAPAAIDLGWLLVGLVAIAVIAAVLLIAQLVTWITAPLKNVPVLGYLTNAGEWVVNALSNAIGWLWSHCNPIHIFTDTWSWVVKNVWDPMASLTWKTYEGFSRFLTHTIPTAIGAALGTVNSWVAAVYAYINGLLMTAVNFLNGRIDAIDTWAANAVNALYGYIATSVAWCLNTLRGEVGQAIDVLVRDIAEAEAAAAAAVGALDAELTGLIGDVVRGIEGDLQAIRDFLSKEIAPALAGVSAFAALIAAEWRLWRDKCGNNLCSGLSGLANDLQALVSLIDDVFVAALIAEIISHPDELANEIRSLLVDPINEIINALGLNRSAA